jgi:CRISPR-associated protein Csd1
MYQKTPIRWLIDLDASGKCLGLVMTEGKGGKNDRGKEFLAPHIGRSSGIRAKLLADTGEYVLGLARDRAKQDRVDKCHQAFVEQLRACALATEEMAVKAVLRFLEYMNLGTLALPDDLNPAHNLTFRVEGRLPIDLKIVQDYWASVAGGGDDDEPESTRGLMQCLICGERRPAVKRLQFKIKRIPGGQPSGMALISANEPAFESYGLEASLIAPTCQSCGERFSKAANALIEREDTHITIGPLIYLFWTKKGLSVSFPSLLSHPEPDEVRTLIASIFSGQQAATKLKTTPFYATAFSASGGRVVVRDWLETTVEMAKKNLSRWFRFQSIVGEWGETETAYFPIQGYSRKESKAWVEGLAECVTPKIKGRRDVQQVSPNVPEVLLHMALKGGPLPLWLLFQAVKRNRAEQGITRPRAALIKIALLSQESHSRQEDTMVTLDPEDHEPAYLCGRLLALLEAVQQTAIPSAKATITDRFFGTASSAPASVFGRLIRGSQPHLGKLRKERRGTYEALQKRLEEVQASLPAFPKALTLQEQGLFGLGYYHQRAANRAAAIAHKQSREITGRGKGRSRRTSITTQPKGEDRYDRCNLQRSCPPT